MEEEQINPLYIKGFNNGYILQQYEPELLSSVLKSDNRANEYIKALGAGKKQYEREVELNKIQKANIDQSKDNGIEYSE